MYNGHQDPTLSIFDYPPNPFSIVRAPIFVEANFVARAEIEFPFSSIRNRRDTHKDLAPMAIAAHRG